jgi:hypothetical protein
LVIIDTLARAMRGTDEASFADMSRAIAGADYIRAKTGAHVIIVHHTGKDKARGARGHSDLIGAPDLIVEISRDGEARQARVTENRNGPEGEGIRFTLKPVETGLETRRGKPVVSAVVKLDGDWFDDLDAKEGSGDKLTGREREALETLRDLTGLLGPVSREQLREALQRQGWGPEKGASWRSAFRTLLTSLERKGLIRVAGELLEPVQ